MQPTTTQPNMMSAQDFANKIRSKYPNGVSSDGRNYADIPDNELSQKIIDKYPVYKDQVQLQPTPSLTDKFKSALGTAEDYAKEAVAHPLETAKGVIKGIPGQAAELTKGIESIGKAVLPNIGTSRTETAGLDYKPVEELTAPSNKAQTVGYYGSALVPVERALPIAKEGAQLVGKGVEAVAGKVGEVSATRQAKRVEDATNLVGQIVQGKKADINKAKEALTSIDTSGVKSYDDLVNALDDKIHSISKAQDTAFESNPAITHINDLGTKVKVGDEEITHNYVNDALSQLKDLYTKTNDVENLAKITQLEQKAGSEGLSVKEVNNLARQHGQDLNAFNANGQAASGLSKQAAENTRVGLKQTAKGIFDNPVYNESDRQMSNLIKTRELVKGVSEKVNQLQQRIQDRSLGAKVGVALGRAINLLGLGTPKGIVESLIPRGQGFKVMNALDLQEALGKNLGKIQEALGGKTEEDIIQKLESIKPVEKYPIMKTDTSGDVIPQIPPDLSFNEATVPQTVTNSLEQEAKGYKSAEEFVKAQGTPVYHGTNRDFSSFDIKRSFPERNNSIGAGEAIYVSPTKELAQKYTQASSNASFDRQVIDEVSKKSKVAGELMRELHSNGYEQGWKNFLKNNPDGIKILEKQGIDPNDIGDVVGLVRGSKNGAPVSVKDQMFASFQKNGYKEIPQSYLEKAKNIGVKSIPTTPKVIEGSILPSAKIKKFGSIKNAVEEASKAKKEGYDGISFINGNGSLEREIAIFNPDIIKTKEELINIWNKSH